MSCFTTLALAVALTMVGHAAAQPNSVEECQAKFNLAVQDFTATLDDKCEALVVFSKCLDAFPSDTTAEMILFNQNNKACEKTWKATGKPSIRTKRGNLQMSVDDSKQVTFYRHRRDEINVFDMHTAIETLQAALDATQKELATVKDNTAAEIKKLQDEVATSIKDGQATTKQSVDSSIKAMQDATDKAIDDIKDSSATLTQSVDDLSTKVDDSVKQLKVDVEADIAAVEKKISDSSAKSDKAVSDLDTKIDGDVKKSIAEVTKLAKSPDRPVHLWSGTPKASNRGENWHNLKLDGTDFDTAMPYFRKVSATHFKIEKSGLYKIEVNLMTHTNSRCWAQMQVNAGGKWINDGTHTYAYSWKQTSFTVMYPIKAGEQVYARVYVQPGCGNPYVYHGGTTSTHSRFQMMYMGQYASKCTGTRCFIPTP